MKIKEAIQIVPDMLEKTARHSFDILESKDK